MKSPRPSAIRTRLLFLIPRIMIYYKIMPHAANNWSWVPEIFSRSNETTLLGSVLSPVGSAVIFNCC